MSAKRSKATVLAIAIDANGKVVTPAVVNRSGLVASIPWERLETYLKQAKQVREEETVTHYIISEHGIEFIVSTRAQA